MVMILFHYGNQKDLLKLPKKVISQNLWNKIIRILLYLCIFLLILVSISLIPKLLIIIILLWIIEKLGDNID